MLEYVVSLVNKTRPKSAKTNNNMEQYIEVQVKKYSVHKRLF